MEPSVQITLSHIALAISILSPIAVIIWKGGSRDKELTALVLRVTSLESAHSEANKSMTASLNEISKNLIRLDERDKVKSETITEIRNDVKAMATRGEK